jgi:hypothetical protein
MLPEVRRFRRAVLRDERLTPEQARRFLRSPAVAVLSRAQFEEHGIPPLSHTATLVPLEGPSPIALLPWSVRTLGPGIVGALDEEHQAHHLVTLLLDPPGTTITAVSRVETMAGPGGVSGLQWFANLVERAKALAAGGGEGRCDQVPVFPGSLLDDLRRLGLDLEERYHWQQRDGAWFVLTGETPLASPFTAQAVFRDSDHAYGAITLTIEPWISADTVLKAYRVYQRRLLGRDNCPRSRRNLAVLQFVTQRSADDGARPGWDTLVEAWNAAHPQWIYRDPHGLADRRRFARDFGRAYRGVVVPSYDRSW